MAIYNLDNYLDKDGLGFPLNFRRGNPNPLDNSSVWGSLEAAQNYAQTDPVAYVGQILTVVEDVTVDEITVKTATIIMLSKYGWLPITGKPNSGIGERTPEPLFTKVFKK